MPDTVEQKYTLEELEKLPLEDQALIYFGVARVLFNRKQTMLAIQFMQKALIINPNLLFNDNSMEDDEDYDDWVKF